MLYEVLKSKSLFTLRICVDHGQNGICHVTRGLSHYGLAICIKNYLKAKEELWKLKYFNVQKYNLQNILEK
jgi:hypothetical protein